LDRQGAALYPVPLLGAAFLAMRRDVFQAVGGFDPAMFWGMEDLELCVRLWMLGYECLLAPGIEVAHLDQWGANPEYQLNWEEGLHNTLRLAILHFGRDRIRRVMQHYADDKVFPTSLARLATGNAWTRRARLLAQRSYDDDWYFGRFNMEI
jgi:GT2 family glycosyltransferase